jgi:hypothetical protein
MWLTKSLLYPTFYVGMRFFLLGAHFLTKVNFVNEINAKDIYVSIKQPVGKSKSTRLYFCPSFEGDTQTRKFKKCGQCQKKSMNEGVGF